MPSLHSSRARRAALAAALSACAGIAEAQPAAAQASAPARRPSRSSFAPCRSAPSRSRSRAPRDGWTITSAGRLGAPLDVITRNLRGPLRRRLETARADDRRDARGARPTTLKTVVTGTIARSRDQHDGRRSGRSKRHDRRSRDPAAEPVFAPYEALAARLHASPPGAKLPVYIVAARLGDASRSATPVEEQIQTVSRMIKARRTPHYARGAARSAGRRRDLGRRDGTAAPRQRSGAEPRGRPRGHRVGVGAARARSRAPNDEQVRVPANGFSLAATLSKPADADGKPPAGGRARRRLRTDRSRRDRRRHSDLRPDRRRAGRRRLPRRSATTSAASARAAAAPKPRRSSTTPRICAPRCGILGGRKDVDRRRIAVVGHSEGGAVALMAAAKDDRIAAAVLIASIGSTGADADPGAADARASIESTRPRREKRSGRRAAEAESTRRCSPAQAGKASRAEVRRQADTPWFQSVLRLRSGEDHARRRPADAHRAGRARHAGRAGERRPPRAARAGAQGGGRSRSSRFPASTICSSRPRPARSTSTGR